jgi:PAS domain S-box-containing protein
MPDPPAPPLPLSVPPLEPRGPGDSRRWAHTVVEHAQDVLTVVGSDGRILYDSPSVLRVLGYAQGELVGRNAFELIHPDDLPTAFELLMETASGPGGCSSLIYRFRHKGGSWRFLESVGSGVADADGVAIVVTSRDVTDRIHAVEAIRRTRDDLEARIRGRTSELETLQMEMLQRLAHAAELRDDETGRHTRRVADLSSRIAARLGLDPEQARTIQGAAPLHDIGKIGIPDAILRKRGSLTPDEMKVMRTHTVLGGRILSGGRSDLMRTAEAVALHHHERWDGGGYPHGLRGGEIPLPARIVAVADFFDALTHDRAYRLAVPAAQVREAIESGAGTHFDPAVANAFRALARTAGNLQ